MSGLLIRCVMYDLYRYEAPSGERQKHIYQFPTIRAAKMIARHQEDFEPGTTALFQIVDAATGNVLLEGLPNKHWKNALTGVREPW